MASGSIDARRRAVWVAAGYIPALLLVAGPLYLGLKAALRWLVYRTDLGFSARTAAVESFADLAAVPLVLAVTWGYLRLADHSRLADLGLHRRGAWALLAGLVLAAAAFTAVSAVELLAGGSTVRGLNPVAPWLLLRVIATSTRAGWTEELVCRGVLLQRLEQGWGRAAALAVSTAVFVLPHVRTSEGHDAIRWVGLVLFGLTMAAAYYVSGRNLWLPIGMHWGTDLWIMILFGSPEWGGALLRWLRLAPSPNGVIGFVDWLMIAALPVMWLFLAGWWGLHQGRRHAAGASTEVVA